MDFTSGVFPVKHSCPYIYIYIYSSYYHLYSVVCVFLEPMSFPKFIIVAQSVLNSLNKLLKSKARMSPKNEIIISIVCISYYPT